jgi:putative transposase
MLLYLVTTAMVASLPESMARHYHGITTSRGVAIDGQMASLSEVEFVHWCQQNRIPALGRELIERIRLAPPSRRVTSRKSNVPGRYASLLMGETRLFESATVELAGGICEYEFNKHGLVLEYYEQPEPILLEYLSDKGRPVHVRHTPDFFVIKKDSAGYEEWKPEEQLQKLAVESPGRYEFADGHWRCPPGKRYAERFGLYYRVRSSAEIQWTLVRNYSYLKDYLRSDRPSVDPAIAHIAAMTVMERPGITLADLTERAVECGGCLDHILSLIGDRKLYVDLATEPLADPDFVRVFPDEISARACWPSKHEDENLSGLELVSWRGRIWQVISYDDRMFLLSEGEAEELSKADFDSLTRKGQAVPLSQRALQGLSDEGRERWLAASPRDREVANERARLIQLFKAGRYEEPSQIQRGQKFERVAGAPTARAIRRWIQMSKAARKTCGYGYIGLLPNFSKRGKRIEGISNIKTRELLDDSVKKFATLKNQTAYAVWCLFLKRCVDEQVPHVSYKGFKKALLRAYSYDQVFGRKGKRGAYDLLPFALHLYHNTPKHGDRPFEVGHIDHTEIEIELVSTDGAVVLGRPWLSLLIDAYSRRVLSFHLSFEPPSYRSCMMVLRTCVQRHGRLPDNIVVDGGPEFYSKYFETFLALFEVTKVERPPGQPRTGNVIERIFGTTHRKFIYNLAGNTQLTKTPRLVTKSTDPKRHAVWTLARLYARLSEFFFDYYDTTPHATLCQSPGEAFTFGLAATGLRQNRLIAYDVDFVMSTMPTTDKGTAKVERGSGVKINNYHYWCPEFQNPLVHGREISVCYDPFDIGTAYAYVPTMRRWVVCHSQHHAWLRGRSEKYMRLASEELRQRKHNYNGTFETRALRMAEVLEKLETEEEELRRQRLKDAELQQVLVQVDPNFSYYAAPGGEAATTSGMDGTVGRDSSAETMDQKPVNPASTKGKLRLLNRF